MTAFIPDRNLTVERASDKTGGPVGSRVCGRLLQAGHFIRRLEKSTRLLNNNVALGVFTEQRWYRKPDAASQ